MNTNALTAQMNRCAAPASIRRARAVSGTLFMLLSGLVLALPAMAASDDPYLRALNAEGNHLESLDKAQKEREALLRQDAAEKAPARTKAAGAPVVKAAPTPSAPATNIQSFEGALRQNFPGSYALYSLMEQHEKDQVYAEYQKKTGEGNARFIPVVVKIIAITNANTKNRERAQLK